ncbi:kinase binding protein CGI-121-domain-containing protein [Halteromyces radiatus]|uniref:kinase binding protein CGI-121-domain-containing protein n=1 Tax=Halteromyces radiatus TaxID=101107 RepID=UPI002220563C|nr:kinase binding protein CGI-121-domain-containing protein [Halteromyces radiatus]KAI8089788.1 kinase binding protein CGI-121-domain-containing protein [Halteromyces radiatus]
MESHTIDLYPEVGPIHMALFDKVTNATQLRQRLLQQDTTLMCALVDATIVFNRLHALLAVNRAIHDLQRNQLKTHNIHSEIVFDFSSSVNIAQSLRRYGINDQSQQLLVIKVGGSSSEVESFMRENIQGELVSLDLLDQWRDMKKIQKYYQLGNQSANMDKVMSLISGAIALKGIL